MTNSPIKAAIKRIGTQETVAKRLGVKRQTIQYWIKNGRVSADKALKFSQLTGLCLHQCNPVIYPSNYAN